MLAIDLIKLLQDAVTQQPDVRVGIREWEFGTVRPVNEVKIVSASSDKQYPDKELGRVYVAIDY